MVTTVITAMAAYSNERVAAIILSVLYRMLTEEMHIVRCSHAYYFCIKKEVYDDT